MPEEKFVTPEELGKHNTSGDLWVSINSKVYDFTDFAPEHPGGEALVSEQAGGDASAAFLHAHPESIMKLTIGKKGLVDSLMGTLKGVATSKTDSKEGTFANRQNELESSLVLNEDDKPPLEAVLNLHDFAAIAQRVMVATGRKQAWDYYSSGADDELTYNENVNAFQRIWIKPRILVNVKEVDMRSTMLGIPVSMPLYLSAVAMCGMGHKDGEIAWTKAAGEQDVVFMVPNLSSKDFDTITEARVHPKQPLLFQIYVNPDREVVKEQVRACEKAGYAGICITVDSAVPGKRERDLRNKIQLKLKRMKKEKAAAKGTKTRKAGSYANRDPALCWDDIVWFQSITDLPIVLKGVQTGEDAVMAARAGCAAVILSNHGGRNLDTSRSGIEVLPEVMEALEAEGLKGKLEVWVDGGVRRGTDILKALALGATAVGVGKPAIYSMSAYGAEGIGRMVEILREELAKCMRLSGACKLSDLNPRRVDATALNRHSNMVPIPPSPYAIVAPKYGTRDPTYPKQPAQMSAAELRGQIAVMQQRLSDMDGLQVGDKGKDKSIATSGGGKGAAAGRIRTEKGDDDSNAAAYWGVHFLRLLWVMVQNTVLVPVVSRLGWRVSLQRSALFLLAFLVVHALGNATVFLGPEAFNGYGDKLIRNPLVRFIEYYLLLAGLTHVATTSYASWGKKKFIRKDPVKFGALAITGMGISAFVAVHLMDIRFGMSVAEPAEYVMTTTNDVNGTGSGTQTRVRDLYALQLALFKSPARVAFYEVGVLAVGVHLWFGWAKAVPKMTKDHKDWQAPFLLLGNALIVPLCIAFAASPAYMYYLQHTNDVAGDVAAAEL